MVDSIGIGIIGSGFGADVILPALLAEPAFCVRAIAGGRSGRGLDNPTVKTSGVPTANIDELLATNAIQAVVVAVPPYAQGALVETALRAGKHVLCEKPFTASIEQAVRACTVASANGCLLAVDYEFRYDPLVEACLRIVASGRIGNLQEISVRWWTCGSLRDDKLWTWRDDDGCCGGVLTEWCSHVIDYSSLIAGADFTDLACELRTDVAARLTSAGRLRAVSAPDGCRLQGRLGDGLQATFDVSSAQPEANGHRIKLRGDHATFIAEIVPPYTSNDLSFKIITVNSSSPHICHLKEPRVDTRFIAVGRLLRDFASSINGLSGNLLPVSSDALVAWRTMAAALASSRAGGRLVSVGTDGFNREIC